MGISSKIKSVEANSEQSIFVKINGANPTHLKFTISKPYENSKDYYS